MKNKKDNNKKWNLNNILHTRLFLIFSIVLVVLLSISVIKELIRRTEINREINLMSAEITALNDNNQELSTLVDYFNSSAFQEKEVKTRLNLKANGEKVVFLSNTDKNSINFNINAEAINENNVDSVNTNNPQKWLNYFFKL